MPPSQTAFGRTVVLVLASCASAPSAPGAPDPVDALVRQRMRGLRLPGLSLAVMREGVLVKQAGHGFADLDHEVAATPATVYEIGSCTKAYTATLVLQLVERGLLSLEDPLTRFWPEAPPAWQRVTVRHALTHTSGIQNHVAVPGFLDSFSVHLDYRVQPGPDDLLARFFALPDEFAPGSTWAYDNTGYWLLGLAVEKLAGAPYHDVLRRWVIEPAQLASVRDTDPRPIVRHRATGYDWNGIAFEHRPALVPGIAFAAGELLADVRDFVRLPQLLAEGRLVPPHAVTAMWTAARGADGSRLPFDYGLGWFLGSHHGARFCQHGGGTPGFSSCLWHFPDHDLTVALLTNRGDRLLDGLAIDIAALVEPRLQRTLADADPDPARTARLRRMVAGLLAGGRDDAGLSEAIRRFLGTASGKGFWPWIGSHGALTEFTYASQETEGNDLLVHFRIALGDVPHWLSVRIDAEGRVSQITPW